MKVELKYQLKGFKLELVSGIVSEEEEVVFHSVQPKLIEKFLEVTGIKLENADKTHGINKMVVVESDINYNLVYKEFTSKDELDSDLIQVVANVNGFKTEGWLGVYDRTIVVYHVSQTLSALTLQSLESDFLMSNILVDILTFNVPVING